MGNIEDFTAQLNPLDLEIYHKRIQWQAPEWVLGEIQYERVLADFGVYHVKTNDTVQEVVKRFEINEERFVFVNGIQNNVIHPGSMLTLREHK